MHLLSLFSLLLVAVSARHGRPRGIPTAQKNGRAHLKHLPKDNPITDLTLDAGWFKFFFGGSGEETAYTFRFVHDDYVKIWVTDAYCIGDSFDLYVDGSYLLTTPRVNTDGCRKWSDDPDVTARN